MTVTTDYSLGADDVYGFAAADEVDAPLAAVGAGRLGGSGTLTDPR